jgi:hypothetical protein
MIALNWMVGLLHVCTSQNLFGRIMHAMVKSACEDGVKLTVTLNRKWSMQPLI